MRAYLVGGAVRDQLMGRISADHDYVVVGSTPDDMLLAGYKQVGADFPVFLHPDTGDEYALARTERKQGHGYGGFVCDFAPDVSLGDDLARRDLTVNAMALDESGALIDPFGGKTDLQNKVFRHVSDAFAEDPLRVLRVARFMARHAHEGWVVAAETLDLMREIAQRDELAHLTPERVWKEMSRALQESTPSSFFITLREAGALGDIFPEVEALFGVPQPVEHHPEVDAGLHTMLTLDQSARLSGRLAVRWGALVHDLGKALTPKDEFPRHLAHEARGVALVERASERFNIPTDLKRIGMHASQYHLHVHRSMEMTAKRLVALFSDLDYRRRPETLADLVMIAEADARGRTGLENRPYPQAQYLLDLAPEILKVDQREIAERLRDGTKISNEIHAASVRLVSHKMDAVNYSALKDRASGRPAEQGGFLFRASTITA